MKVKIITQAWLKGKGACEEALQEWNNEKDHETITTLQRLIKKNPSWANWLIVRVMTRPQYLRYAIYAAEEVIDIYERKYPKDKRPRKAIEAAKICLKRDSKKNHAAADAAAYAAADAAFAAFAAFKKMQIKILNYGMKLIVPKKTKKED